MQISAEVRDYTRNAHKLVKDYVWILKVIVSHARCLEKKKVCVEKLIQLAKVFEVYFRDRENYDTALAKYASVSQKTTNLSSVNATSVTEWVIKFAWSILCQINDHFNINLFILEAETKRTETLLKKAWPRLRFLFIDDSPPRLLASVGSFEQFSEDGRPIFRQRQIPSVSKLDELESESKRELAHLVEPHKKKEQPLKRSTEKKEKHRQWQESLLQGWKRFQENTRGRATRKGFFDNLQQTNKALLNNPKKQKSIKTSKELETAIKTAQSAAKRN